MKTFGNYLEEYYRAISQGGDFVVKRDVWIYFKWTEDMGINSPVKAHEKISELEDGALKQSLQAGERVFLGTK